jgi:hypothetical protein
MGTSTSYIIAPEDSFTKPIEDVGAYLKAIEDWQAIHNVEEDSFLSRIWFRGLGKKYDIPLRPGVYRDEFTKRAETMYGDPLEVKRLNTERHVLGEFRSAGASFLNTSDEVEIYFIAQHHGVPTRLLDWTSNPLAALFFAVEAKKHICETGEIFVMNADKVLPADSGKRYGIHAIVDMRHPYVTDAIAESFWLWPRKYRSPLIIPISPDNRAGRSGQQNSRFTLHMHQSEPAGNQTLAKMKIPGDAKRRILKQLHRMNVNQFTIFNDLDHLSNDLKRAWNI